MEKTYIFVLCSSNQAYIIIINLLNFSKKVSTFINSPTWESQLLLRIMEINYMKVIDRILPIN